LGRCNGPLFLIAFLQGSVIDHALKESGMEKGTSANSARRIGSDRRSQR
jgi:hypothetical protein